MDEVFITEPYGFIYITTNLINGKRYLGQKKFLKGWKSYLGSGSIFRAAVKKYGKENFSRNIIQICYSADELNQAEYFLSIFLDVVKSDDWYNLCYGGGTTSGYHMSDEAREKISKTNTGKKRSNETKAKISELKSGKNNHNYGKHFSDEHKNKIAESVSGEHNGMYGKHQTEKAKQTVSQTHKGKKKSEESNKKRSVSNGTSIMCLTTQITYCSSMEAHRQTGINRASINRACKDSSKSAGKHPVTGEKLYWEYAPQICA